MTGLRKASKITALKKLNEKYDLKLDGIDDMSTSQLRKTILKIRHEKGLTIHKLSKFQNRLEIL